MLTVLHGYIEGVLIIELFITLLESTNLAKKDDAFSFYSAAPIKSKVIGVRNFAYSGATTGGFYTEFYMSYITFDIRGTEGKYKHRLSLPNLYSYN